MIKPDLLAGVDRLDLIQTFISIVECGSLSAAAVVLGTSQPTVSRRLQALERYLGLTLVQRSTHELKLTESGARVFNHAKNFLETWESSVAYMRGNHSPVRERLRVSVPSGYSHARFIAAVSEFLRQCPDVSIDWLFCDGQPNFAARDIDCAIQIGGGDTPGLARVHLAEEPRIVVAAPHLWGPGAPPRHAGHLVDLPWISLRASCGEAVTLAHDVTGEVVQVPITPRLTTDGLCALRSAALQRLGACVVSTWIVADDLRTGQLVHLAPEWFVNPLPVSLVYPRSHAPSRSLKAFVEVMRSQVPRLNEVFSIV